jgi:uncharacterized membrane protein YeaQ/YmgE (transglycosylase-associated protein family)
LNCRRVASIVFGIVGAFVATYLGSALGWYRPGEGAGLIDAVVGAVIVLFVYGFVVGRQRRNLR